MMATISAAVERINRQKPQRSKLMHAICPAGGRFCFENAPAVGGRLQLRSFA
jgi:hypothetical protein